MAVKHSTVVVGASATPLIGSIDDTDGTPDRSEVARTLTVQNAENGATVYIGGPGVTTTSYGYRLKADQAVAFDLTAGDEPYAVTATSQAVTTLHTAV
jgi:hypothetical protein